MLYLTMFNEYKKSWFCPWVLSWATSHPFTKLSQYLLRTFWVVFLSTLQTNQQMLGNTKTNKTGHNNMMLYFITCYLLVPCDEVNVRAQDKFPQRDNNVYLYLDFEILLPWSNFCKPMKTWCYCWCFSKWRYVFPAPLLCVLLSPRLEKGKHVRSIFIFNSTPITVKYISYC